jgi:hypothetical protein
VQYEPEVNRFPWLELHVRPRAGDGRVLIRADEQLLADQRLQIDTSSDSASASCGRAIGPAAARGSCR